MFVNTSDVEERSDVGGSVSHNTSMLESEAEDDDDDAAIPAITSSEKSDNHEDHQSKMEMDEPVIEISYRISKNGMYPQITFNELEKNVNLKVFNFLRLAKLS